MKNKILTMAMLVSLGLFTASSYASGIQFTISEITCGGGHECSDKCKKDKDGKCAEATEANKGKEGEKAACCSKESKKSCHKKEDSKDKSKDKESTDPKS